MRDIDKYLTSKGFYIIDKIEDYYNIIYKLKKSDCSMIAKIIKGKRRPFNVILDVYSKLMTLDNTKIVKIYDAVMINDDLMIIMDFVEGLTLNKYLKSSYFFLEDKELFILKKIFKNIAIAIDLINENGISHTDIIGSNIIVNEETLDVKIVDYDFSILMDDYNSGAMLIDKIGYVQIFLQSIHEQIYLNKEYNMYNSEDVLLKMKDFKVIIESKGFSILPCNCLEIFNHIFNK